MTHTAGWDAEALRQSLAPVLPGITVEVMPEVESTNSLLLARPHSAVPCLLVAHKQTQGRGRMGRAWVSAPGASLTFSLALTLAPLRWEGLSLAVGLALADALEPLSNQRPRLQLKWPNDLWLCDEPAANEHPGRKLGGVLIETAVRGAQRLCVIGVGLNVLPLPALAAGPLPTAPALTHGYASMHELLPGSTAAQVLARVVLPLALALRRFEAAGFAPLTAAFAHRDLLLGRAVSTTGTPPVQGVAQGVDSEGALLVRCAAAASPSGLQRVHSGEVSVRLNTGGAATAASNVAQPRVAV